MPCYKSRRYVLAGDCKRHRTSAPAGTPATTPAAGPARSAAVRQQAIARARAQRRPQPSTRPPRPPKSGAPASAHTRARARAAAQSAAIERRIIRPDGTYALAKTWRRRLGGLPQPRHQRAALQLFDAYVELNPRRADRIDRERAAFRLLVTRAHWRTLTSCTTREQMAAVTGVGLATISVYLAAWQKAGLIRLVLDPLAPEHARGQGAYAGAGRAPIYGLTSPPELAAAAAWWTSADLEDPGDAPLAGSEVVAFSEVSAIVDRSPNPTHVSASYRSSNEVVPRAHGENSTLNNRPSWPGRVVPVTDSDRSLTVRVLADRANWGNRVDLRALAAELAPFFAAGWCLSAVIWALDHLPTGGRRVHTDRIRQPVAWVRFRLTAWKDRDGKPLPPPVVAAAPRARTDQG